MATFHCLSFGLAKTGCVMRKVVNVNLQQYSINRRKYEEVVQLCL